MKYLKKYLQFKESILIDLSISTPQELMESLNVWHDALLSSVGAEEVDIFDTFKLPKDLYKDKLDLEFLKDNIEFINSLSSIALKKSPVENTETYQTFVNKPCKFMFIYDINSNELDNPLYMLFQVWNETLKKWSDVKLYKINDDIKKLYDKLSSKTVEVIDGDENYIYTTSNGNEWELQNLDKENDIYKRFFRKDEFNKLLSDRKVKVSII